MLILEVVQNLQGQVVVVRGVSRWRAVGGDEGGEGGRRRCGRRHGGIIDIALESLGGSQVLGLSSQLRSLLRAIDSSRQKGSLLVT